MALSKFRYFMLVDEVFDKFLIVGINELTFFRVR